MGRLFGIRFERHGAMLFAGWWQARVSFRTSGRFSNGRRFWSGWHRFPEPDDFEFEPMMAIGREDALIVDELLRRVWAIDEHLRPLRLSGYQYLNAAQSVAIARYHDAISEMTRRWQ